MARICFSVATQLFPQIRTSNWYLASPTFEITLVHRTHFSVLSRLSSSLGDIFTSPTAEGSEAQPCQLGIPCQGPWLEFGVGQCPYSLAMSRSYVGIFHGYKSGDDRHSAGESPAEDAYGPTCKASSTLAMG
jgi:hypothetical protein